MFILRSLKQEPLLIFLIIAVVLFGADYSINHNKKNVINITPEIKLALLSQERATKGSDLTPSEEDRVIENYINNKILLADAIRLGLDNDRTIQTVLLKKYRVLKTATIPEPTAEDLDIYYNNHKNNYMSPVAYDIQQVYFSVGANVPESFATQLRGADNADAFLNSQHMSSITLPKMGEHEISARMGKDVASEVVKANTNVWVGPITNERGTYFIRTLARYESTLLPMAEVKNFVRDTWIITKQDEILQNIVKKLKENYSITITDGEKE